jgi:hypothetical protein
MFTLIIHIRFFVSQLGDASQTPPWREIDKGFIATGKELGSGFFGVVLQGTVILDGQSKQCAVKTLKRNYYFHSFITHRADVTLCATSQK